MRVMSYDISAAKQGHVAEAEKMQKVVSVIKKYKPDILAILCDGSKSDKQDFGHWFSEQLKLPYFCSLNKEQD